MVFINGDAGISTVYQSAVPALTQSGARVTGADPNAWFPIICYFPDMGSNGDPWTRFSLTATHSRDALQQIQDAAFNTLCLHWLSPNSTELARIEQTAMKVIANMQTLAYQAIQAGNLGLITNDVNRIKNSPALIGYHLFDEDPTDQGPLLSDAHHGIIDNAGWQSIYNTIRNADAVKAIWPNNVASSHAGTYIPLGGSEPTYDFRPYSDVWMADAYIITAATANIEPLCTSQLQSLTSFQGGGGSKPFIYFSQCFHDVAGKIRPTNDQMRAMIWSGIILGATGWAYFPFHSLWAVHREGTNAVPFTYAQDTPDWGGISQEVTPSLWAAVTTINKQIQKYQSIIFRPTATDEYHVEVDKGAATSTTPVRCLLKKDATHATKLYLFVTNIDSQTVIARFRFARKVGYVRDLFSGTVVPVNESTFQESLSGYATRLYEILYSAPRDWDTRLYHGPLTLAEMETQAKAMVYEQERVASGVSIVRVGTTGLGYYSGGTWTLADSPTAPVGNQSIAWNPGNGYRFAADVDGDGRAELITVPTGSTTWHIRFWDGSVTTLIFGNAGDIPLVGDWDGDGIFGIGVFRPSTGQWFFKQTLDFNALAQGAADISAQPWGQDAPYVFAGDWNGDGKWGIAYRYNDTFHFSNNLYVPTSEIQRVYGLQTDIPVVGDWNADGKWGYGLWRGGGGNGEWLLVNSITSSPVTEIDVLFGPSAGITPVTGNWKGV